MKVRSLLLLLLPLFLATCSSCTQQPENKAAHERKSRGKTATAAKLPIKVNYLAGEILSISRMESYLIVQGKSENLEVFADKKTLIKSHNDNLVLSDLSSGDKVTVRYVSLDGKNVAKSIFVAQEKSQEHEIRKQENAPTGPHTSVPSLQAPLSPGEKWPPS